MRHLLVVVRLPTVSHLEGWANPAFRKVTPSQQTRCFYRTKPDAFAYKPLQRVAQGESLCQIARSYHISYEAIRRMLNAARKEWVAGEGASTARQHPEDEKE